MNGITSWLRQDHLVWNTWLALGAAVLLILFIVFVIITGRKLKSAKHMADGYGLAMDWLTRRAGEENDRADRAYLSLRRVIAKLNNWVSIFGDDPSIYRIVDTKWTDHDHNKKSIAVDLDGVIIEYDGLWKGPEVFGPIIPGAIEGLKQLKEMGFTIIVYTTRNNCMASSMGDYDAAELTNMVRVLLDFFDIPYDYISLFKPLAAYYLDDRAVRFTNWTKAVKDIKTMEVYRAKSPA
jgi:hypothetical protein